MKRLVEDFDDMMKVEDEVSVEDAKSPLEKELIRVYEYLKDKGETDIKEYETAYQEAIEKIYPENLWWEVIDLNIFWDLFENQNPRTTIDNIISSVKPEFKKEVIDTVVTEDVEEENPLKDIRSNVIEFPNGEYVCVEYDDGKLYAGSATNTGIIHEYEMDYDKDFDVDKNLQDFFDKIIEENSKLGEPSDESKKVCEDTVKQGNKWVNKGKDGTHGTFKTKKAADAQRKAMFANKGKKSTFGESRKSRLIKESDDEEEYIDTEATIHFEFDGIGEVYDDGDTASGMWVDLKNGAYRPRSGSRWTDSTYNVEFANEDDVAEALDTLVENRLPTEAGTYKFHIVADLPFKIEKIKEIVLGSWYDYYDEEYYDDVEYDDTDVECEFERDKAKLIEFTVSKVVYVEGMKRKPKKNLKEAADDEIELFMNTWANYNEHGADGVITPTGWMSLDEAEEYADKYEEYEPFINDTENVPEELGVNEYSDISETVDMLRKYEDFDDTQKEVFAALIDDRYEVDKAFDIVDDNDYFYVKGDDDAELAENYIDELGGIESFDRDTLERYFDYGRYGRDLAFDFIKTDNGYVSRD